MTPRHLCSAGSIVRVPSQHDPVGGSLVREKRGVCVREAVRSSPHVVVGTWRAWMGLAPESAGSGAAEYKVG